MGRLQQIFWMMLGSVLWMEAGRADDFFSVGKIKVLDEAPARGFAVTKDVPVPGAREPKREFVPCLKVQVGARKKIHSRGLFAKAYFYDRDGKLLVTLPKPTPVLREEKSRKRYAWPVYFDGKKSEDLFFALPPEVLGSRHWKAIVVFGDKHSADAGFYPRRSSLGLVSYPEKELVENGKSIKRKEYMDPLITHVVKTRSLKHPKITLFMLAPPGMVDASEADGVLAMCVLAHNLADLKRRLKGVGTDEEMSGIIKYAAERRLIILCWGSRYGLWNSRKNWDDHTEREYDAIDREFYKVANAWARGVEVLSKKYGMPNRNFLLSGSSGSAQYACRLALRKPEYFLGVSLHIPSSFDKPTPAGREVLWSLTTGELESGYERSLRFVAQCREMGYPIIYKAIPGLGHEGHPQASALRRYFFDHALAVKDEKLALQQQASGSRFPLGRKEEGDSKKPWPQVYQSPYRYADVVNQEVFPAEQVELIPEPFRIALPTRRIAELWSREYDD